MFKRPSNRNFDELRNITLEANFSPYAEDRALQNLETHVCAQLQLKVNYHYG